LPLFVVKLGQVRAFHLNLFLFEALEDRNFELIFRHHIFLFGLSKYFEQQHVSVAHYDSRGISQNHVESYNFAIGPVVVQAC
jgi:hypothetical protein